MNTIKQITRARNFFIKNAMPDVCYIKFELVLPPDEYGVIQRTWANRLYKFSERIPCRFDVFRGVYVEHFRFQPAVVDVYTLDLPYDMYVEDSDIVELDDGRVFKIKRMINTQEWRAFNELLLVAVSSYAPDS